MSDAAPTRPVPTPASKPALSKPADDPLGDVDPFSIEALDDRYAAQRYLMKKGWKPLGSPRLDFTRWWDPTRSKLDSYKKEIRQALHLKDWNEKTKQYDYEMAPVMVKDRTGRPVPCEQSVLIPAGQPYDINMALTVQRDRDREAAEKDTLAQAA